MSWNLRCTLVSLWNSDRALIHFHYKQRSYFEIITCQTTGIAGGTILRLKGNPGCKLLSEVMDWEQVLQSLFYSIVINKSCAYFNLHWSSEGISICLPAPDFLWKSETSLMTGLAEVASVYIYVIWTLTWNKATN